MLHKRLNKFIRNPKKALFTLALPSIIAMTVQTLYNVMDTAFVGHLGVEAIAALTFCFPVFFIFIAVSQGINAGTSAKIAQFLGAKNKTAAENVALHGLIISAVIALLFFVLGLVFLKPLFVLIGAQGNVLKLTMDYMNIVLLSVFFLFPAFVFHGIFASQGDTKTPMILQSSALFLNMILDYILIYPLGFGVKGAAMATTASFIFNLGLGIYFARKKSLLHIHPKNFHLSAWISKKILFIGAPASLLMLLMSVYITTINHFLAYFSSTHIAAFGIAFRFSSVAIMPVVGMSIALLTLVGMFYGAKKHDLTRLIVFFAIKISLIFTSSMALLLFIFPHVFLRIFTSDLQVIRLGSAFMRIDVFIFPLLAVIVLANRTMQGLGTGLPGLVVNITRVLVVAIPLSYVFIFVLDLNFLSVALADVIGGFVAAVVAVAWIVLKLKKLHLLNSAT